MLKKLSTILSTSDKRKLTEHLKDKGKKKPKSWTLVHSEFCGPDELNFDVKPLLIELSKKQKFAIDIVSNPNAESSLDFGQFRVRYRYVIATDHLGESLIKDNTREFCAALVRAKKLYRKEDINIMSFRGSNPISKLNYSIFKLKGHWNCRHAWAREIYVIERDPAETENNPIAEKTTLMSKLEKAVKAFKNELGDTELTKEQIVEINRQLLSKQKFLDVRVEDKILRIDADTLEEGAAVSWIDEEGTVSEVANGELTLVEEGKVLTIEGGVVTAIVDVEEAAEEEEGAEEPVEMADEEEPKEEAQQLSADDVKDIVKEALSGIKEEFAAIVDDKLKDVPAFASNKKKNSFKASDDEGEEETTVKRVNKIDAPFSVPSKK